MAEIAVHIVLRKLSDLVFQEALSQYKVSNEINSKIKSIERELKWIQSFVKDADTKRHKNERVKCWVNEVQEVSYLIEDTLEKFLIKVGGADSGSTLKKMGKLPMKLYYENKLGAKIDKILQRLNEISDNTNKYKIERLDDSNTVASSDLLVRPYVIPGLDETEVVGFEDDMEAILEQLVDAKVVRRSVVSIVGAGGFGKTTLAKKIYERTEVRSHFAISLWVTVSEEYKLKDILIKILEGMGKSSSEMRQKEEELIIEIYNCMKERTYLVVLDDVWSADLWTQLQDALPKTNNGSRVLVTTRFINIVEKADALSKPYKIKPLNEEKSKQLLLKQIFPNQYANECPEDLLPLAPQFVKKCGGCPLALVVLGGFLSRRCPTYNAWDDVMRNMDWHADGNECMGVLSTSFNNLPIHLKTCFMYFANFPEDYQIKVSNLVQLWIAEGFIPHDASKTMEDIAERYLEELVQRCMVQVSRRSIRGKIKYCQIHDLLREVAIKKAKEDNFLTVFSKNDTHSVSCFTPRVSLNNCGNVPLEHTTTNLRTVNYFGGCVMRNWKRFGMLRVLNLMDESFPRELISVSNKKKHEINWLEDLTALRYFGEDFWSKCHEDDGAILRLSYLSRMKNLQTVNIYRLCKRDELPMSLWENKVLRHVNLKYPCSECGCHPEGPPSSADLQNLLTLKGVVARQEWSKKLPHFPHLRKLEMDIPKCVDAEAIINSVLSNLQDLGSLSLSCEFGNMVPIPCCYAASAFRSHQRLHSFSQMIGIWPKQTSLDYGSMFPPHLLKLQLELFMFKEDPMPHLEKLPNLTVLALYPGFLRAADGNKRMTCSRRGFGRLQELALGMFGLEEWKIEEGAMPQLNKLKLQNYDLKTVPDLQYLTNLRELKVLGDDEEFKSKMQGDDQEKIKHITSVTFPIDMF